jgi:hypothetical protein
MITPEGFPLLDGVAVSSERFFVAYDQDKNKHWLCYRITRTVRVLPESMWGNVMGIAPNGTSDGLKIARVPAIGIQDGDPCYWYTKTTHECDAYWDTQHSGSAVYVPALTGVVHIALPFETWAARVPLERSQELRDLVREGSIPRMNHGEPWPEA